MTENIASFEDAVAMGMHLLDSEAHARWGIGDLVAALVTDSTPDAEKPEDRTKRINKIIKDYASALKLNRNTVRERYDVATFYPASVRSGFATLHWSHWRAATRHGLALSKALAYLDEANGADMPVGKLERLIAGGDSAETVTMRRVFEAEYIDRALRGNGTVGLRMSEDDIRALAELTGKSGFTCELRVSWQESRNREVQIVSNSFA